MIGIYVLSLYYGYKSHLLIDMSYFVWFSSLLLVVGSIVDVGSSMSPTVQSEESSSTSLRDTFALQIIPNNVHFPSPSFVLTCRFLQFDITLRLFWIWLGHNITFFDFNELKIRD